MGTKYKRILKTAGLIFAFLCGVAIGIFLAVVGANWVIEHVPFGGYIILFVILGFVSVLFAYLYEDA